MVERSKAAADLARVRQQVTSLLREGYIQTVDGGRLTLDVQGIGLHGDGPNALEVATTIRETIAVCGYQPKSAVSGLPIAGPTKNSFQRMVAPELAS